MKIEFDTKKSIKNDIERGLPFDVLEDFEWEAAVYYEDTRKEYGEIRFIAIGYLFGKIHHICFTIKPDSYRIISLRRANKKEIKYYEKATSADQ